MSLHTVIAGSDDGQPVVLLYGFPEFWYRWRFQIPALADAGYRVIVPDPRGYNRSGKLAGIDAYTVDTLGADVIGLLDYEQTQVLGHDWGGRALGNTPPLSRSDRAGRSGERSAYGRVR